VAVIPKYGLITAVMTKMMATAMTITMATTKTTKE
jgi:hypothetical protein